MPINQPDNKNTQLKPGLRQEFLGLSLLFLMILSIFYPMFFLGKAIFHRDYHFFTYPFRYFLGQAYQQGVIPFWTPHVYGGMPFMSLFHPGVFYPPSILFLMQDTVLAINLFYFTHFLILGFFLFLLGKLWALSFAARLCISVTGMLNGFIFGAVLTSNYFMAAVWLPMIFWAFLQFRKTGHFGYFIGTVLAIATQTLAACPEISMMTVGLLFLHQFWFIPKGERVASGGRLALSLGLAVILALGLSALQLWPSAELMPHSPRAAGLSYEIHAHWSLEPVTLATLVLSPFYIGDSGGGEFFTGFLHTLYMGLVSLAFIFISFLVCKERPIGFWLTMFALGIFFALGQYNPFYEYFYHAVPLTHLFRFPSKYYFISSFAAVFLTGFVLDAILKHTETRRLKIIPVLTVFILVSALIYFVGSWWPALGMESSLALLFVLGLGYTLFYFGKIRKVVFTVIIVLVIFIDLSMKDFKLLPLIDRSFYDDKPVYMKYLKDSFGKYRVYSGRIQLPLGEVDSIEAPSGLGRIKLLKEYLTSYTGMVYGIEHFMGKPGLGLGLKSQLIWSAALKQSDPERRLRILKRSNVRYWIDLDRETRFTPEGEAVILPDRIRVIRDALPRAYFAPNMRAVDPSAVLSIYYDASFDPLQEVLLSEPVNFQPSAKFEGQVTEVTYRPNHVTVKTSQKGNGFLVLNDTYFSGWTVTVDGQQKKILKANRFFRAVLLGSGEHTLEFDYFPEGFKEGLIVSGVTPVLGLVGYVLWRRRLKSSL